MDEQRSWSDRFARAAEDDIGAADFDVAADVRRGRARLWRIRLVTGAAGAGVVSVVLGTAVVLGGGAGGSAPAGGDRVAHAAAAQAPTRTPAPTPTEPAPPSPGTGTPDPVDPMAELRATAGWRNGVYDIAASVLDPQKEYLNYDTRSLQSGGGPGYRTMGVKLGWRVPGARGEGLVQISISDATGPRVEDCMLYLGKPCDVRVPAPSGYQVRVGHGASGEFAVRTEQPDGDTVLVYVNPLFGNDARVPVRDMQVRVGEVKRLTYDERLDLPSR